MLNVCANLFTGQWLDPRHNRNSLPKLHEIRVRKSDCEWWLTCKDNLQKLVGARLKIGQHTQLLEDWVGKILGLVHEND